MSVLYCSGHCKAGPTNRQQFVRRTASIWVPAPRVTLIVHRLRTQPSTETVIHKMTTTASVCNPLPSAQLRRQSALSASATAVSCWRSSTAMLPATLTSTSRGHSRQRRQQRQRLVKSTWLVATRLHYSNSFIDIELRQTIALTAYSVRFNFPVHFHHTSCWGIPTSSPPVILLAPQALW